MRQDESDRIADAYMALVEVLYLNAHARLITSGDSVASAVVRTSSILLRQWVVPVETTLRALARDLPEQAVPDDAHESGAFAAPDQTEVYLETVSALLRRVLCVAESEWFRAVDELDCAGTTLRTIRAIDTLRALRGKTVATVAPCLKRPVAPLAAPGGAVARRSAHSPRPH